MFSSLKNKIREETGSEIPPLHHRNSIASRYSRNRESTSSQHSADDGSLLEQVRNCDDSSEIYNQNLILVSPQKDAEINSLKTQLAETQNKLEELSKRLQKFEEEKSSFEKANTLLEESLKVAQGGSCFSSFPSSF